MPRLRRLEDLLPHIREGRYRLGPHAAKHMLQEGFREQDILSALLWGRELAIYPEDERMLVLGYMVFPPRLRLPLHVDIVTAFIPREPYRVYSRARLAALLRFDGALEEVRWTGPKHLYPPWD